MAAATTGSNLAWYDPKAPKVAAGYTASYTDSPSLAHGGVTSELKPETASVSPEVTNDREPPRAASKAHDAPKPEEALAFQDAPGLYRLVRKAIVKEGASWESAPVRELPAGATIEVLEVTNPPVDQRVRARIAEPAGWISLLSVANGVRFADRVDAQASSVAGPSPEEVPERREQPPQPPQPQPQQPPPQQPAQPRDLSVNEVARTVDAAVRAKEELAKHSISKARAEMLARKADMEARHAEEERRIKEAEAQLVELETELSTGVSRDGRARVEELRRCIESVGKEVAGLEREVVTRKEAMRRATEAYVDVEEKLAEKREVREQYEKEMLDLILTTGKAKDEKMNSLLSKVPDVK